MALLGVDQIAGRALMAAPEPVKSGPEYVLFKIDRADEVEPALSACLLFAGERAHQWTVIPSNGCGSDVFRQPGYIGCSLSEKMGAHTAEDVRKAMLGGFA